MSIAAIPDEKEIAALHALTGAPQNVIDHERAVAEKALELAERAESLGYTVDTQALTAAALVHDICRLGPKHAERGAELLRERGYGDLAEIVRAHHDGHFKTLDEAALLYLADKLVAGTESVTLEERFARKKDACLTPEAAAAHARRFDEARRVWDMLFPE